MKTYLAAATVALFCTANAQGAERIGVVMGMLQTNFQSLIVNGMKEHAATIGVDLQIEDAANDVNRQVDAVRNFSTGGVSAIIVDPIDSDSTATMSQIAADAGIPLVYVNIQPSDLSTLKDKQAFVGSDERESGTLQTEEVCRRMGGKGDVVVMVGDLTSQTARQRTADIHDVLKTPKCQGMKVVQEQVGNWGRVEGADLVANWLTSGVSFQAVIANNDEMALGAINALKASNASKNILVAGIDATPDALTAMKDGDLHVTVFQDAKGQGVGAVDTALKAARGEAFEQIVWIPFELVTPETMTTYEARN